MGVEETLALETGVRVSSSVLMGLPGVVEAIGWLHDGCGRARGMARTHLGPECGVNRTIVSTYCDSLASSTRHAMHLGARQPRTPWVF